MIKKILILMIFIASLTFLAYFNLAKIKRFYYLKTNNFSNGTGATHSTPDPSIVTTSEEIQNLQSQLPYSTNIFTINKFDFKTARFAVEFKEKSVSNEYDFTNWLKSSEFSKIPLARFDIK